MNFSILYNPYKLVERLAAEVRKTRRLQKLKNKPGANLKPGHIDSLELLELIHADPVVKMDPVIFDIGSNTGTWTLLAKSIFANAKVHAFEPLEEHNLAFEKNCSRLADVHLHSICAGNENTTGKINISSFTDSSSILEATPLEFEHFNIRKEREVTVNIRRLADLIAGKILPAPEIIKLDIQGYELEALKGLDHWLQATQYIICEVSFKEYYYGQPLFMEIAGYLAGFRFQLHALGYNTPLGAELNQIDVLFKRNVL